MRILVLVTLMLITVLAKAGVYKCETSTGLVYSEKPCAKDSKPLNFQPVKPSETVSPPDKLMQQMESENRARKKNKEAMEKSAADVEAANRKIRCAAARHNIEIWQRQERIFSLDKNGERIYLDDDTRAAKIDSAKKEIDSNCDS